MLFCIPASTYFCILVKGIVESASQGVADVISLIYLAAPVSRGRCHVSVSHHMVVAEQADVGGVETPNGV